MSRATGVPAVHLGPTNHVIAGETPGGFYYATFRTTDDHMLFSCPCGCGEVGSVNLRPRDAAAVYWENTGTREKPTLSPALGIPGNKDVEPNGYHWHGRLTDGVWESS